VCFDADPSNDSVTVSTTFQVQIAIGRAWNVRGTSETDPFDSEKSTLKQAGSFLRQFADAGIGGGMKWPWAILVCSAGCSSAPVADTLDWLRPAQTAPARDDAPTPRRPIPTDELPPLPRAPANGPTLPRPVEDNNPPPLPPPPG